MVSDIKKEQCVSRMIKRPHAHWSMFAPSILFVIFCYGVTINYIKGLVVASLHRVTNICDPPFQPHEKKSSHPPSPQNYDPPQHCWDYS